MAAKSYAYNRLVMSGTQLSGGTWSIGLAVQSSAAITPAALTAWLDGIAGDVGSSFMGGPEQWGLIAGPDVKLTTLTTYHYPAGSESSSDMAVHSYGAGIAGGGNTGQPALSSLCVSLLSDHPGRHGRGRVYCPAGGATLANHQLDAVPLGHVVRGVRDLVDHINGSTLGGEPCVVGIASMTGFWPVSRVRGDSIPDTQHRRSDKLVATATVSDDV